MGRKLSVGAVSFASHVAAERNFLIYGVDRTNTVWDTRFVKSNPRSDGGPVVIFFLLDGWIRWHEREVGDVVAPAVFSCPRDPLDGTDAGNKSTRSAGGDPFRAIQLSVRGTKQSGDELMRPLSAPESTFVAAREVLAAMLSDPTRAVINFLDRCAESGLVDPGLSATVVTEESPGARRVWNAFSSLYMTREPIPPMQELADRAGVSTRQFARDLEDLSKELGLEWETFRELATDIRLRWATLLLSHPDLPIADVAHAAGFASNDALALAFRQAGLPSPREVRRLTLEAIGA